MQKLFVLSSIGLAVGVAGSVVTAQQTEAPAAGAGRVAQQTYRVAPFERVSAVGPNAVVIAVGRAPSVRAEGDRDMLDRYEAVVEDGELRIRPRKDRRWGIDWPHVDAGTFYVTVPRISAATLAGSGNMSVDRVEGGRFAGTVAGSGTLAIAAMAVEDARLSIAGSGDLSARGTARTSKVEIAGSGDVQAHELSSGTASVSVAGSGDVALTVNREADVSIVGSGDVDIAGSARCAVSKMGSGDVRCPA